MNSTRKKKKSLEFTFPLLRIYHVLKQNIKKCFLMRHIMFCRTINWTSISLPSLVYLEKNLSAWNQRRRWCRWMISSVHWFIYLFIKSNYFYIQGQARMSAQIWVGLKLSLTMPSMMAGSWASINSLQLVPRSGIRAPRAAHNC